MKIKDLKINFRYLGGNMACLSVDSISGESVHNDINNEEAIIIFNSLVGEKADCQTVKSLLKENQELKKQLEEYKEQVNKGLYNVCLPYKTGYDKAIKDKEIQQKEFIKYLEDYINSLKKEYGNYVNDNYSEEYGRYYAAKEILQKYKEIIGGNKDEK